MKELVDEKNSALLFIPPLDDCPHVRGPACFAPGDRCVEEPQALWMRGLGSRLAGGDGLGGRVGEHHRTAERDAPELPAVALAERRGLLEVGLRERGIGLAPRRRGGGQQAQAQDRGAHQAPNPTTRLAGNQGEWCAVKESNLNLDLTPHGGHAMIKKAALLMIAAGAYAVGFWPSWWVRDAVLQAFG